MNQINCPICGRKCVKSGKTSAGSQRWLCKKCGTSFTCKIDRDSKELKIFLDWLFGKDTQATMSGGGRTFRRNTAKFWNIWTMPPMVEETKDERLLKAQRSLLRIIRENVLFTYLDEDLCADFKTPSTNNRIEGGVNSRLREMLRNHRGLSIERRIKAVYWWCYMHSPEPISASEILKVMPTDKSIAAIYQKMNERKRLEKKPFTLGRCNCLE